MRRTGEAAQANRDIILGIKIQVGSNMNGKYSLPFLKIAPPADREAVRRLRPMRT